MNRMLNQNQPHSPLPQVNQNFVQLEPTQKSQHSHFTENPDGAINLSDDNDCEEVIQSHFNGILLQYRAAAKTAAEKEAKNRELFAKVAKMEEDLLTVCLTAKSKQCV